jgi:hypothetical protein
LSTSVVLTSVSFLVAIGFVCVVGSIRAPVASVFIVTVVAASVLIGHRGTIVYTALSLAALLALWWAEGVGLLVSYVHQRAGFAAWLTLAASLLGVAPLIVPLTLLKHHLSRHPVPDWVHQQVYLHPYLKELMLCNQV